MKYEQIMSFVDKVVNFIDIVDIFVDKIPNSVDMTMIFVDKML